MRSFIFRRPYVVSLGIAILIVAAIGLLSYRDWSEYETMTNRAAQTRALIDETRLLLSLLKDAETGQRGYLLTGDESYLTPYTESLSRIRRQLVQMQRAGESFADPETAARLPRLIIAKLDELAATIETRRKGDIAGAMELVRSNRGKEAMDEIRADAGKVISSEEQRLSRREALVRSHEARTRIVILLGTGLLTLLLIGAAIHVDRLIAAVNRGRDRAQRERATLQTTLQSIGDAVIATDFNGRITFTNPVAQALTGWSGKDAAGMPLHLVFRIISESDRLQVEDPVSKVLRLGTMVGLANHTLLLSKDGREIPIYDNGAPIHDENGQTTGVVLVFRDVTAVRKARRELEASEWRYRLLFENNPQPMYVFDSETLAFLAVNPAAERTYGYSRDEFLTMTLKDIRPPEEVPALLETTRKPVTAPRQEGTWKHRRKDGSLMTVEIVVHPFEFEKHPARMVLATDVTERLKLEQQFQQAQRLESIGRLAGGIAHDFNNLLTVITGYTEMAMSDLPPDSEILESLVEVRGAANRAAALTQQLLAFSRKQLVQTSVFNLNHVVTDVERMLSRLIGEDIQLKTRLAGDLGNVKADVGQLQQVIMNLAVNARDAMPRGGSLLIETSNVFFGEEYVAAHPEVRPGGHVMLAVTDNGTGMTEEVKQHLFEPFFTTKPKGSGTGLGLATVYGMVRQNGGWIWVYTELGSGTTFKVYLPRTDEQTAPPRAAGRTVVRGHETILVVEDQPEVRALAVAALQRFGYVVLAAEGGPEALALSKDFAGIIHLLLTDVVMPVMNGRQLADELTALRRDLRVLFMSGYTENAIAHHGVLDSGVAYIQKPFSPEALGAKVREVLGRTPVRGTVLVVDEDAAVRGVVRTLLSGAGFAVLEGTSGPQLLELAERRPEIDLVILGLEPEAERLELARALLGNRPSLKIIAISGTATEGPRSLAASVGTTTTLPKPIDSNELLRVVREALGG